MTLPAFNVKLSLSEIHVCHLMARKTQPKSIICLSIGFCFLCNIPAGLAEAQTGENDFSKVILCELSSY